MEKKTGGVLPPEASGLWFCSGAFNNVYRGGIDTGVVVYQWAIRTGKAA